MRAQTAASYLPDCQVITLHPDFAAFDDPGNIRGFQGPDQIGFFFHEWIHYLHNVSTIQGLSAFANFIHLWAVFRRTIDPDEGLSAGSAVLEGELALNVRQKLKFMSETRKPRRNNFPETLPLCDIEFVSVRRRTDQIEGTSFDASAIECEIAVLRQDDSEDSYTIEVGTHEIMESAAFMLEERLTLKLGSITKAPCVDPYLLVRGIAAHVVPEISEDSIVRCALLSLQDSDPPRALLDMLHMVRMVMNRGDDPLQFLGETGGNILLHGQEWVEETLQEVESIFPVDEPMARAVKSTTKTIRQNFVHRRAFPFLELGLIERIVANPAEMTGIVETHGACAVIQQRKGQPDDIDRDLMYDFVLSPSHDDDLSFGWRMMHAAFRFVASHCGEDALLPTNALPLSTRHGCPFYTACSHRVRQERQGDCATRPWLAAKMEVEPHELCWYGRAVYTIAPRS